MSRLPEIRRSDLSEKGADQARVERIWKEEGLKVPRKQPKRGRLWFNDGSCLRLRPTHANHVWSVNARPCPSLGACPSGSVEAATSSTRPRAGSRASSLAA